MNLNLYAMSLLKHEEGCRLTAYAATEAERQKGIYTIGWGYTHHLDGTPVKAGETVTQAEADRQLSIRVAALEQEVQRAAPKANIHQQAAFVSFAYNEGFGAFRESTLLQKFNAGDIEGASHEFDRWVFQVYPDGHAVKLAGLVRRRHDEEVEFGRTGP